MHAEKGSSALRHRDRTVDAFDAEWAKGHHPRIEDFLPPAGASRTSALRALIDIECKWRRRSGEQIPFSDLATRFPELSVQPQDQTAGGRGVNDDDRMNRNGRTIQETVIEAGDTSHDEKVSPKLPLQIGRYRAEKLLGQGGFGLVFLAKDDQLNRPVAIKVPHARRLRDFGNARLYLDEARVVASLDHPHIVPVYDVGSTERFPFFLVSKFIDGSTLAVRARQRPYSPHEAASLIVLLADALHYAHTHGVVHRDVKPGNVLIDQAGNPYLVDFGLAMHERDYGTGAIYAGTPAYMSPEQARGEGHRVDGRSDIFSTGVVLYELLVGRRPFGGKGDASVLSRIATSDPKPPRQIRDGIPKELERICLKALARRAFDRYPTAKDLADDLKAFTGEVNSRSTRTEGTQDVFVEDSVPSWPTQIAHLSNQAPPVIPHGLRSFDHHDANFFLSLLPGPKDRDGLPESVRFWKSQIEETDADATFPVGLIYGPSGCGKTSFVKAGLIPRLTGAVLPVYVEATAGRSVARLLAALRKACPELAEAPTLTDAIAALRIGRVSPAGRKVLIVLDQFEQWLHAPDSDGDDLVGALRQCDGVNVQCLILARDDFCVAVGRFFQALEVPIREGHNYALVDLFDLDHAWAVLHAFGHAFGRLPIQRNNLTKSQREFLDQAVAGLASHGKVISLRLALFAEMMRGKNWVAESLQQIGGAEGIGFEFLEETFASRIAPPTHRMHEQAARAILKALLPESGTDIRGRMQPASKLLEVSGYANRKGDFRSLIELLEREVRLIAPTEPDEESSDAEPHYQLTHDFLVPALREWLYRKQRETAPGRAELCLSERTALWQGRQESKQLPDLVEWLRILTLTSRKSWTEPQRTLMRRATHKHLSRVAVTGFVIAILVAGGLLLRHRQAERQRYELVESLLDQLWTAQPDHVGSILDRLEDHQQIWRDELRHLANEGASEETRRIRASLALTRHEPFQLDLLSSYLLSTSAAEHSLMRNELRRWKDKIAPGLWGSATDPRSSSGKRLRAAAALAAFDPKDPRWKAIAPNVASAVAGLDPLSLEPWIRALQPACSEFSTPLSQIATDRTVADDKRLLAASVIRRYAEADSTFISEDELVELALGANAAQRAILLPLLDERKSLVRPRLEAELGVAVPLLHSENTQRQIERQANAAELLLRMGNGEHFWSRLTTSADPRLRTKLIDHLKFAQLSWEEIEARLSAEADGSVRQAILLGLAGYRAEMTAIEQDHAIERLAEIYSSDPDSGVHSASEWVLKQWDQSARIPKIRSAVVDSGGEQFNWIVNGRGQTLAIIREPGTFRVGSPAEEAGRGPDETLRDVSINYTFAVGVREISVQEFLDSAGETPGDDIAALPAGFISWYDAVRYCRWLSEQEGIEEDEICYPPRDQIGSGMVIPADFYRRTGYRLPTATEWEYLARANSRTSRFYGDDAAELGHYAWYANNSEERPRPGGQLRPNPFGIFDIYGNVTEWVDGLGLPREGARGFARGGHYRSTPKYLRSASAEEYQPDAKLSIVGFRIARTLR